jgi:hypothetical protein
MRVSSELRIGGLDLKPGNIADDMLGTYQVEHRKARIGIDFDKHVEVAGLCGSHLTNASRIWQA